MQCRRWAAAAAVMLVVAGCSVNKTPIPVGGSRSDGTVDLSYEFGVFQNPQVDYAAAQASAQQRCSAWGYKSAEMFGGEKRDCVVHDAYGTCTLLRVTITYQCTAGAAPALN